MLLAAVPLPYRMLAAGLLLAAAAGGAALWLSRCEDAAFKAGAESVRAELREQSEAADALAREQSRERAFTATRIDTNVLAAQRASAPVLAAAASDGNGLRLDLAAHRGQSAARSDADQCAAERAYSERLAGLLDESSRLVEEGAGIAAGAVALIDGLQARDAAR